MTTIVYKDGLIACDGRVTCDGRIMTDTRKKRVIHNNIQFFMSGADATGDEFIDKYPDGVMSCSNFNALVVDDGIIYMCGAEDDGRIWRSKQRRDEPEAIGSGSTCALTAASLGYSAKDCVKIAITQDSSSGGKIRVYKV